MEALARELEMDVKADHCAAGLGIHFNFLDVQGVDGKDIAVGLALRRRCAAVSRLAKIGAGLNGLFRQLRLTGTGPLRQDAGIRRQVSHQPEPVGASGS